MKESDQFIEISGICYPTDIIRVQMQDNSHANVFNDSIAIFVEDRIGNCHIYLQFKNAEARKHFVDSMGK